ncbi:DUF3459 domain-containing protein, partial [Curtobacterium sp. ME12]|uniref:DUF3459 domain-containing protein n=1 Tax=Curtobacterium sp. ME12 TaxID=2744253 RepID=UPI0021752C76
ASASACRCATDFGAAGAGTSAAGAAGASGSGAGAGRAGPGRANSKLDWADVSSERGAAILRAYRVLIALRRTDQAFVDHRYEANAVRFDEDRRWLVLTRGLLGPDVAPVHVVVNLADDAAEVPVPDAVGEELYGFGAIEVDAGVVRFRGRGVVVLR